MNIKKIKSRNIYSGRVFSIKQDIVLFPNGHEAQLDIITHPGAVVIVPVDESGNIWFVKQYRHAAGEILLELPAGTLEQSEDPEQCALREIREEIGMATSTLRKIGGFYSAPGYTTEYLHIFMAENLSSAPLQGDLDEMITIEKIPISSAYLLAESGQIRDSKTLASLLLVKQYLNEIR
jgi:ADP-ribose pyrophosphatase